MKRWTILLLWCVPLAWADVATLPGWEHRLTKAGIDVYTRSVPGHELIELNSFTTMNGTVDELLALYMDVDRCGEWLPDCKRSNVVDQLSEQKYLIYRHIKNPFPFKHRDYVIEVEIERDDATGEVTLYVADVKDALAESKCCVRMEHIKGMWKFTPLGNNQVKVQFQYHFHPGGKLPTSMINKALPSFPIDTLGLMQAAL